MRSGRSVLKWLGLRLVIYYALGCTIPAIFLGEFAVHPANRAISPAGAESMATRMGVALQDVVINAEDGIALRGWFMRPARANGKAVLLLHGVADDRRGMMTLAKLFLSHGFSVLVPDSRGHGESGGYPSFGVKEVGDVKKWYDWLKANAGASFIYALGESMGAAIALQSIKGVPFAAVVAESPFANFRDIAYIRVGQFLGTGAWMGRIVLRPAVELAFLYCLATRGVWLPEASPEKAVAGTTVPVLLIHGLADDSIPFQQSEKIQAKNPAHVSLWKVPQAMRAVGIS
jgi:alpha-beta hydrolase superfamily lysophospholipase